MAVGDKYHGLTYREVLGISRLAYRRRCIQGLFYKIPIENSVWEILKVDPRLDYSGNKDYSFRAVVLCRKGDFANKILAFSGSDQPREDWGEGMDNFMEGYTGDSPQYRVARQVADLYKPKLMVGHSLGGGLASAAAIYTGIKAVTVNPAPLNVKAYGQENMNKVHDKVINLVVKGEALDVLQDLSYKAKISEDVFSTLTDFSVLSNAFPKFKTTKAVPYMKRVGSTKYIRSNASSDYGYDLKASVGALVNMHVLDYMVGFVEPEHMPPKK